MSPFSIKTSTKSLANVLNKDFVQRSLLSFSVLCFRHLLTLLISVLHDVSCAICNAKIRGNLFYTIRRSTNSSQCGAEYACRILV